MSGFIPILERGDHLLRKETCPTICACSPMHDMGFDPRIFLFCPSRASLRRGARVRPFLPSSMILKVWRVPMIRTKDLALVMEQLEQEHQFSGTILIAQDGSVVFEHAYGFASRQLNV